MGDNPEIEQVRPKFQKKNKDGARSSNLNEERLMKPANKQPEQRDSFVKNN